MEGRGAGKRGMGGGRGGGDESAEGRTKADGEKMGKEKTEIRQGRKDEHENEAQKMSKERTRNR